MCVCVHIQIDKWIYRQIHKQIGRQINRQIDYITLLLDRYFRVQTDISTISEKYWCFSHVCTFPVCYQRFSKQQLPCCISLLVFTLVSRASVSAFAHISIYISVYHTQHNRPTTIMPLNGILYWDTSCPDEAMSKYSYMHIIYCDYVHLPTTSNCPTLTCYHLSTQQIPQIKLI